MKRSYPRWNSNRTWENSKATKGSSVDQVELTGSDERIFGTGGFDAECGVGTEEQSGVPHPEGAIMKTVSTKIAF